METRPDSDSINESHDALEGRLTEACAAAYRLASGTSGAETPSLCRVTWRFIHLYALPHFATEEETLFPAAQRSGVDPNVFEILLRDHDLMRAVAQSLSELGFDERSERLTDAMALALRQFFELFEWHVAREEAIFRQRPLLEIYSSIVDRSSLGQPGFFRFEFEREINETLDFVPMDVKRKLDLAGVKMSVAAWRALRLDERRALCDAPIDCENDAKDYAARVEVLAETAGFAVTRRLPSFKPWNTLLARTTVEARAHSLGVKVELDNWLELAEPHRYALVRLADRVHAPARFVAALRECGAASPSSGRGSSADRNKISKNR